MRYKTMGKMSFAAALKLARTEKGLTQKELGTKIGVNQEAISALEKNRNPNLETLKKLSAALEIEWQINDDGVSFKHFK